MEKECPKEEWRPIGRNNYQVSSHGRVRGTNGLLTPIISNGYKWVHLYDGYNNPKSFSVHSLVAQVLTRIQVEIR